MRNGERGDGGVGNVGPGAGRSGAVDPGLAIGHVHPKASALDGALSRLLRRGIATTSLPSALDALLREAGR